MSNWNYQQQYHNNSRYSNNQDRFNGDGVDNFTNFNATFYNRTHTEARGSTNSQRFDVESSNLHATAAEFTPRNLTVTGEATASTGTVRKNPKYKPWKQNYGNNSRYKEQNGFNNHERYNNRSGRVNNRSDYDNNEKYDDKVENRYDNKNPNKLENNAESDNRRYKNGKSQNSDNYSQDDDRCRDRFSKGYGKNSKQDNSKYFEKNNGYGYKNKWNRGGGNQKQNKNASETNWRQNKAKERRNSLQNKQSNQRERLQDMLERFQLECMVCCERLRHTDSVWSCKQCYNILHLSCIKKWANTSKLDCGWRCPACQNTYASVPEEYFCYCEKMSNPKYEPGQAPHSCGEICGRKGRFCEHPCVLLCHPGPCPECTVSVSRSCGCGATKATVSCNTDAPIVCGNQCNKLLNCGVHVCAKQCHAGDCAECGEFVCQECYCGKVGRKVKCTEETINVERYECDDVCGKLLNCGNHRCELGCHSGSCAPCSTSPTVITTCPCGQTKLNDERTSCFDPIPSCDKVCNKLLKCGQPSDPHRCQEKCHQKECPPCPLITMVRCRCGYMDKEVSCAELTSKADDARCQKKCTKMRLCCKHKCNQYCCIEVDHHCTLICNRALSCGLHRCEQECHRGRCGQCPRMSFDELFCECGASVVYPPVACGTRPPTCNQPCSRPRPCGHPVAHTCHTGPCPPCTVLCKRWCHGKHEQRGTILCHQDEFSCGLPCGKELPCRQHKCIQACHKGSCALPCVQPCPKPRLSCDHPCNQPCHPQTPCPDTPCRQTVKVTCQCGLRSSTRSCMDLAGEYQAIAMSQLASKMADIQKGQTVDLTDIVSGQKKHVTPKTLECTEECRVVERNRRLAIGLQIRNPDLSAKLTPRYSDFMRGWAKKDPRFCQHIHDKLSELVQLAKQSKQKSRSHSFETMNRDKRHLVHEYCEHFGCESEAYDAEPNRNVVATAFRDKSWLPSVSLMELIQRENGQRKVPGPMVSAKSVVPKREVTSFKVSARPSKATTQPGEYVDYFDDPPI